MFAMVSHIMGNWTVCSTTCSSDHKNQGSTLLVLCVGKSPVTDRFPSQRASNAESFTTSCCLHETISQIPQCIRQISHNAPFCSRNVHTGTFLQQNAVLWDMGPMHLAFVKQIYSYNKYTYTKPTAETYMSHNLLAYIYMVIMIPPWSYANCIQENNQMSVWGKGKPTYITNMCHSQNLHLPLSADIRHNTCHIFSMSIPFGNCLHRKLQ